MKKIIVAAIAVLGVLNLHSQGIYKIWGIAQGAGNYHIGSIFNTNSAGDNFQEKYEFSIQNLGSDPNPDLTEYNGKFYGTTRYGGADSRGTIFEWDPVSNVYATKFEWTEPSNAVFPNGTFPNGALTLYNGKLYGVTFLGGTYNKGVLFEFDPATNVFADKVDFDQTNGAMPHSRLTLYNGKFYGSTGSGGAYDKGVIFEWDPVTSVYTKKIDLLSSIVGAMTLSDDKFYGLKFNGDEGASDIGEIFEWDPNTNVYTKKHDFVNPNQTYANGGYPSGELVAFDGKFYGVAKSGGSYGGGVIFEWYAVTNTYIKLFDFDNTNGGAPNGTMKLINGKFYGTTGEGGSNGKGIIFEWDPSTNAYSKKYDFGGVDGSTASSGLTVKGSKFYGCSKVGGSAGNGTIFEWDPATSVYTRKIDFNGNVGSLPNGALARKAGKFYGMTAHGGLYNGGAIFEWDPATDIYTKKIDLSASTGAMPVNNGLILLNNKFYGVTSQGGSNNLGVIFEWDPVTNIYTKKHDFALTTGSNPRGRLLLNNGKFYGMTNRGGVYSRGVIFEWDPVTNVYTKKIDFNGTNGGFPYGGLAVKDGKFYGMTLERGTSQSGFNQGGVIFEWDPETNVYTKKIDFTSATGHFPYGNLSLLGEKFYGMTHSGGSNGGGVIFEWDPATNVYTKKVEFTTNSAEGSLPVGTLTLSNGKFYGISKRGGAYGHGVFFEWDPAMNVYTKKQDLDYGGRDYSHNVWSDLTLEPVAVAKGFANSCKAFASIVIDNNNNNKWVSITDEEGNAVAEIKANGNNLGMVTASMYTNDGAVREDGNNRLYLDRSLTITPQVQPSTPVDIRLYITEEELQALKTATNSAGQPSGVTTINNLGIFKNGDPCSGSLSAAANAVTTTGEAWLEGHVLSASINGFSSFYFANKASAALPLDFISFTGRLVDDNAVLNWETENEINTSHFEMERSTDGRNYVVIGKVNTANTGGIHKYAFTDNNITSLGAPVINYRITQKDLNGQFTYSRIVALGIDKKNIVLFYPNPVVNNKANLTVTINRQEQLQLRIVDNMGRVVKQQQWNLQAGSTSLPVEVKGLAKGVYHLELKGNTINKQLNFLVQ
jgi:uncharacterized repeat protein (TIGR03803 family)